MSEIKAVLLIPTEGDPHGLLHEGPCGARPPMVEQFRADEGWAEWRICIRSNGSIMDCRDEWGDDYRVALVLAWDGKPVAEGLDRLSRAIRGHGWLMQGEDSAPAKVGTWALSVARDTGTLVLLDADGLEVGDGTR